MRTLYIWHWYTPVGLQITIAPSLADWLPFCTACYASITVPVFVKGSPRKTVNCYPKGPSIAEMQAARTESYCSVQER
ncbi:hypothetical protein K439DRAFT_1637790 [Ramaria rubella]|nr:hypothetical protein K439DRAFT_1637790 [Ramaria rubella]